jgi:hypothetical protein
MHARCIDDFLHGAVEPPSVRQSASPGVRARARGDRLQLAIAGRRFNRQIPARRYRDPYRTRTLKCARCNARPDHDAGMSRPPTMRSRPGSGPSPSRACMDHHRRSSSIAINLSGFVLTKAGSGVILFLSGPGAFAEHDSRLQQARTGIRTVNGADQTPIPAVDRPRSFPLSPKPSPPKSLITARLASDLPAVAPERGCGTKSTARQNDRWDGQNGLTRATATSAPFAPVVWWHSSVTACHRQRHQEGQRRWSSGPFPNPTRLPPPSTPWPSAGARHPSLPQRPLTPSSEVEA